MTDIELLKTLGSEIEGDLEFSEEVLEKYSRDASLFKVVPHAVVWPKSSADIQIVIMFVREYKLEFPWLSITARAAGTDMTGGAIGEGIILDTTKYMNAESVDIEKLEASVEPGVFFRDFEKETLPNHISLPIYPASKSLAALGGMIMNNCGGEKTLRYGQINNFVNEVVMNLSDGNQYTFKKLNREELDVKLSQTDFEGEIYNKMYSLITENYDVIKNAKPKTSKNSSGYQLWNVYDKEKDTFDLSQLFVGSQGTLGIMSDAKVRLIKTREHKRLVVLFLKEWQGLPDIVNKLLPVGPESMETFDDVTLKLGIRFMPQIAKNLGQSFFSFALKFLPEVLMGIRMLGLPKLIVLVEIVEDTEEEAILKTKMVKEAMDNMKVLSRVVDTEEESEKYWAMRRESFALLRKSVKTKKTAPFIEDVCVLPKHLPEVLPQIISVLKQYGINVNIAGHAGSGNLHIIPLMDLSDPAERSKILDVSDKIYEIIIKYGGTITAEHNDGIIRTPYVVDMFGINVYQIFQKTKNIFDPENIFNPGKKVGGTKEYIKDHMAE
jgi:FAD/FMN-containing dehydrogenase